MSKKIIFCCVLIGFLTGCGSKGDLYLPKKAPEQTKIPNKT